MGVVPNAIAMNMAMIHPRMEGSVESCNTLSAVVVKVWTDIPKMNTNKNEPQINADRNYSQIAHFLGEDDWNEVCGQNANGTGSGGNTRLLSGGTE